MIAPDQQGTAVTAAQHEEAAQKEGEGEAAAKKAQRSPKKKQALTIGTWKQGTVGADKGATVPIFVAAELQPKEAITEVQAMVAWANTNYKEPGTYEFIRRVPGVLTIKQREGVRLEFTA